MKTAHREGFFTALMGLTLLGGTFLYVAVLPLGMKTGHALGVFLGLVFVACFLTWRIKGVRTGRTFLEIGLLFWMLFVTGLYAYLNEPFKVMLKSMVTDVDWLSGLIMQFFKYGPH